MFFFVFPNQAKRAELLQFAQCAISGLKINPEISRLALSFGRRRVCFGNSRLHAYFT